MRPQPKFRERPISTKDPAGGSIRAGIALVIVLFALIYAKSLTFVYIEGDDASSVAYHAMGRIPDLQPPYSAYQSMMDSILGWLPANEHVLRVGGMLITSLAAPVLVILIGMLAFAWAPGLLQIPRWAVMILVPLLAPEFIYLGLVYTPALVAMACALAAHVLLRRAIERSGTGGWAICKDPSFALSVVTFGVGTACRWDILAYGAVIAADTLLAVGYSSRLGRDERKERFRIAVLWGGLALLAWLITVILNGYGPLVVLRAIQTSGPAEQLPSLLVMLATLQTFATPALVVLAAIGFVIVSARKDALSILVMLGLLLIARYVLRGVPKWILIATPGIMICALIGFSAVWTSAASGRKKHVLRASLIVLVLAPWLGGVRAVDGVSAYGPGFEVQPFDRPLGGKPFMKVTLRAGALIPTPEGPRPLGGHAWVLLGGGWRDHVTEAAQEQARAIQEALARNLPLLWDHGEGFAVSTLLGMHFMTPDSANPAIGSSVLVERRFTSQDGKQLLKLVRFGNRESLFRPDALQTLEQLEGCDTAVLYGYTSTIRQIYQVAPASLQKLGPSSALLDLDELRLAAGPFERR